MSCALNLSVRDFSMTQAWMKSSNCMVVVLLLSNTLTTSWQNWGDLFINKYRFLSTHSEGFSFEFWWHLLYLRIFMIMYFLPWLTSPKYVYDTQIKTPSLSLFIFIKMLQQLYHIKTALVSNLVSRFSSDQYYELTVCSQRHWKHY